MTDIKKMYSVEEVAKVLTDAGMPITSRSIRYWIKDGKVKSVYLGPKKLFVPAAEVQRLLDKANVTEQTDG